VERDEVDRGGKRCIETQARKIGNSFEAPSIHGSSINQKDDQRKEKVLKVVGIPARVGRSFDDVV